MYYIVNQNQQIVAADSDFLSFLGVGDMQELLIRAADERIKLNEKNDHTLEISTNSKTVSLPFDSRKLFTPLGDLYLYMLSEAEKSVTAPTVSSSSEQKNKSRINKITVKPKPRVRIQQVEKNIKEEADKVSEPEKKKERIARIVAKPVVKRVTKSESGVEEQGGAPHTEKQKENLLHFVDKRRKEKAQTQAKATPEGEVPTEKAIKSPEGEEKVKQTVQITPVPASRQGTKLENAAKKLFKSFKSKEKEKEKESETEKPAIKTEPGIKKADESIKFPDLEREKEDLVKFISASEEEKDRERENELMMFPEIEKETGDLVKFVSESEEEKQEEESDRIIFPELKEEKRNAVKPAAEAKAEVQSAEKKSEGAIDLDDMIIFPKVEEEKEEPAKTTAKEEVENKEKRSEGAIDLDDMIIFPKVTEEEKPAGKKEETGNKTDDRVKLPGLEAEKAAALKPEAEPKPDVSEDSDHIIFPETKGKDKDDDIIIFPELGEVEHEESVKSTDKLKPDELPIEEANEYQRVVFPESLEAEEEKTLKLTTESIPKEEIAAPESEPKEAEKAKKKQEAPLKVPEIEPEEKEEQEILLKVPEAEPQEKKEENFLKTEEKILLPSEESITVDTEALSKILGISKEDYGEFLDEFIEKAKQNESVIRDKNNPKHHKEITSLIKLAQMLHLTALADLLKNVSKASADEENRDIESFYRALSHLTITTAPEIEKEEEEEVHAEALCSLNLENIKPIHFDFQIEQAATDLGLPVSLIREFVDDFIVQARDEKETFVKACQRGDIDTVHKTGHKLKGAASNLRINPLAATLEEIQFCEERSRLEPLLKKYWGQFLAFELFMQKSPHKQGRQ